MLRERKRTYFIFEHKSPNLEIVKKKKKKELGSSASLKMVHHQSFFELNDTKKCNPLPTGQIRP